MGSTTFSDSSNKDLNPGAGETTPVPEGTEARPTPGSDAPSSKDAPPRPEEILASILKAKRAAFDAGKTLERVVMPMAYYRALQEYHAHLGEAPYDTFEYLSRYEIMGLPIYIDNDSEFRVE